MIRGTGVDIVDIRRIEKLVQGYADHFINRVFTGAEIAYCGRMADPALHYAGRWAAKEAFYKALPLSCQKVSTWKSIEILSSERGRPEIHICSDVLKQSLEREQIGGPIMVSISHERAYCVALVVLQTGGL